MGQPADGTLVDIRTTHFGSGGTAHVTRYFLEARFDDSDHKTSRKAARQAEAESYQAELHAEAGTIETGGRGDDKGARLERLTELYEQGTLTDAEFEAQMHSILRSS